MKCPKCRYENPEDSAFCLDCGKRPEINCPECGHVLPTSAKLCNKCGRDLSKPKETLLIDPSQPRTAGAMS